MPNTTWGGLGLVWWIYSRFESHSNYMLNGSTRLGPQVHHSTQATITKYQWPGASHSSEGWNSEIKVPAQSDSGESFPLGLQMATFSLYAHMTFSLCEHEWGGLACGEDFSYLSSSKGTNPIIRAPPSWPHITLITSQRFHLQICWG